MIAAIIGGVILVFGFFYYLSGYKRLKKSQEHLRKEFEKLKYRNTSLETHQLKYEFDSHTLKNMLAEIKAMSNKISRGIDALSGMLDYIYNHSSDHYSSVEKEVGFVENYINLKNISFNQIKNFEIVKINLDESSPFYTSQSIPHLITTSLVENAFKHGDSHHPEFLKITIQLNEHNFEIEVKNKVRKNYVSAKPGIGLENMRKRLRYLKDGKHNFESQQTEDEYVATLKINLK